MSNPDVFVCDLASKLIKSGSLRSISRLLQHWRSRGRFFFFLVRGSLARARALSLSPSFSLARFLVRSCVRSIVQLLSEAHFTTLTNSVLLPERFLDSHTKMNAILRGELHDVVQLGIQIPAFQRC